MTEAPPPCEKCLPYMEPRMDVVPAVIRAQYTGDLVVHAQRLHAEIAELRARFECLASDEESRARIESTYCSGKSTGFHHADFASRIRAALAPKGKA